MTTIRLDSPAQEFPYAASNAVDVPVSTVAGDSLVLPTKAIIQKLPGVSRLICLDVGGVLANKDTEDDYSHLEPLEGCREFLEQLKSHGVGTVVNSAHPVDEVTEWLQRHGLFDLISGGTPDPALYQGVEQYGPVVAAKPRAEKYLDDRMVRYKGDYEEALDAILDFRPWWADKGYEVDSVALDFDATLNTYGMANTDDEINRPSNLFEPQDGAREFVAKLYSKVGRVVIFSCRNPAEIQEWLKKYRFERHIDAVESYKPKVKVYLDDRGMRFKGDYAKTLEKLRLLEPERKAVAGGVLGANSPPGNSTATPRVYEEPQTKTAPGEKLDQEAAIVIVKDEQGRILTVTRPDSPEQALPGGLVEEGERPEQAARREVQEETGVALESLEYVRDLLSPVDGRKVSVFKARWTESLGTPYDTEGAGAVQWLWPDELFWQAKRYRDSVALLLPHMKRLKQGPPHSAAPPDPQWTDVGPEQEPRPTYPPPEDFGTSTEPRPAMYANGWATPSVETVDKSGEVQPTTTEMYGDRFGNAPWNNDSYGMDHNSDLPSGVKVIKLGVNAPDLSHAEFDDHRPEQGTLLQVQGVGPLGAPNAATDAPQKKTPTREVADAAIEAIRHVEDSNRGRSAQKLREMIWPVFQHWEQQIDASEGSESDKKRAHSRLGTFIRPHASFSGGVRKVGSGPEGPGPAVLRLSDSPTIVADIKQAYRTGYYAATEGKKPEDNPWNLGGEPYKSTAWSAGWQDGISGSAPQAKAYDEIGSAYLSGYVVAQQGGRREDNEFIVGAPMQQAAWEVGFDDATNGREPQTKDYFPGIPEREQLEGDHPTYSMWGDGGWKSSMGNPNDGPPTGDLIDYRMGQTDSGPMVPVTRRKSLATVDYVEFPIGLDGLKCGNCRFFKAQCKDQPATTSADFNGTGCATGFDEGFCDNPDVMATVKFLACCNNYDHAGIKRPWKGKTVRLDKTGSVEQRDDGWWYRMPPNRESGPYPDRATALGALGMEQINYHRSKTAPFSVERRDDGWWVVGPVGTWNEHGPFDEWEQADRAADRLMNKAGGAIFPGDPSGLPATIGTEPEIPT